ncbi:MAG: divergent polysaccharide deacetylase family protein, partial [Spirochaetia bacterium]|nr:divergent polysaccharide deacetylase family protein [Spirochaetia bacterium]
MAKKKKKNYSLIVAALIIFAALLVLIAIVSYQPSAKPQEPESPVQPAPEPQPQPQVKPAQEPEPAPAKEPEAPKKRIYLILDDGGHNTRQLMPFLKFPGKLAIAVIPRLEYSAEVAELTYQHGKTVMLHQPMQPLGKADPGEGAIYVNMSDNDVR